MDEQEIINAAAKRFADDCDAAGLTYDQPGSVDSYVEDDVVTLANFRGPLARYRFEDDGEEVTIGEQLEIEQSDE